MSISWKLKIFSFILNLCEYSVKDIKTFTNFENWILQHVQWWFVNPDSFVPGRHVRINEFSGLLNRPSVQERKSVPALFVRISEISGLSEPGLTNHHCIGNNQLSVVTMIATKRKKLLFLMKFRPENPHSKWIVLNFKKCSYIDWS